MQMKNAHHKQTGRTAPHLSHLAPYVMRWHPPAMYEFCLRSAEGARRSISSRPAAPARKKIRKKRVPAGKFSPADHTLSMIVYHATLEKYTKIFYLRMPSWQATPFSGSFSSKNYENSWLSGCRCGILLKRLYSPKGVVRPAGRLKENSAKREERFLCRISFPDSSNLICSHTSCV